MYDARLGKAIDEYTLVVANAEGRPFEMGVYVALTRACPPDVTGLSALEPLLTPILRAVPSGIVTQKALAQLVEFSLQHFRAASMADCPRIAGNIAASIRVALAHVRRLSLRQRLLTQRSKGASPRAIAGCQRLAALFQASPGDVPPVDAEGDASDAEASPRRASVQSCVPRRGPAAGRMPSAADLAPCPKEPSAGPARSDAGAAALSRGTCPPARKRAPAEETALRRPAPAVECAVPSRVVALSGAASEPPLAWAARDTGDTARADAKPAEETVRRPAPAVERLVPSRVVGLLARGEGFRPAGIRAQSAQVTAVRVAAEAKAKKAKDAAGRARVKQAARKKSARIKAAAAKSENAKARKAAAAMRKIQAAAAQAAAAALPVGPTA